jgi:hypothetical protein
VTFPADLQHLMETIMRLRRYALAVLTAGLLAAPGRAAEPKPIPAEDFDKLAKLIKPQPGELLFQEIPWLLSVHDARVKAAAEGKPILVWSGSGGAPLGVC